MVEDMGTTYTDLVLSVPLPFIFIEINATRKSSNNHIAWYSISLDSIDLETTVKNYRLAKTIFRPFRWVLV